MFVIHQIIGVCSDHSSQRLEFTSTKIYYNNSWKSFTLLTLLQSDIKTYSTMTFAGITPLQLLGDQALVTTSLGNSVGVTITPSLLRQCYNDCLSPSHKTSTNHTNILVWLPGIHYFCPILDAVTRTSSLSLNHSFLGWNAVVSVETVNLLVSIKTSGGNIRVNAFVPI